MKRIATLTLGLLAAAMTAGASTRNADVLTYATASSPFAEVVLKGDAKLLHLVRSPGRIKLCPIRGFSLTVR